MISMIWAMDESNLIGSNNKMPWHVKEDLIYYKNMTKDYPVVMGYNTYLSLLGYYEGKNFPYKKTYVLTSKELFDSRVVKINSVEEFVKNLDEDIFIVGGKNTYNQFYPYADFLYVTYIKGLHSGDTYMEPIDLEKFSLISEKNGESGKARFTIYKRVR